MNINDGKLSAASSKKILIGVFGLSEYEFRLVRSVLNLTAMSRGREHSYALVDAATNARPDIIIADPDNPQTIAHLGTLADQSGAPNPAKLFISNTVSSEHDAHYLPRPLAPTKMLALLDKIATITNGHLLTTAAIPVTNTTAVVQPLLVPKNIVAEPVFRALIVDDSPTVRIKIGLELRQMNIASDCAETGEQGLQMLAKNPYDIIFLDIVLPGADGYEICKAIRHNMDTKRIPVIMLTSKSSPFDRIRGSLAGCSSYLTKPVEPTKFHSVVEGHLPSSKSQNGSPMGLSLAFAS
ncbi:MAG: response regulator [Pseudomonadota bacterium]